ncbi:MAG TPA: ADP-ribosylglycohydrolase family protein [Thermohalobaculum sp.]|nr:ADP-ribosylglycohydrolase family protein [Thermohalobaculum sp.]
MFLGLAAGDAVGTTVEFRTRGSFEPVTGMTGGGPFHLAAGEWTDDTAMAICLAESLIECGGWNAIDCMDRFFAWSEDGYASCTGSCFDIGMTIARALSRYRQTGHPYAGSTDPRSSGNGAIMRLSPAVIALADAPEAAVRLAVLQGRLTHASSECDLYAERLARLLITGDPAKAEGALPAGTAEAKISSTGYVRHTYEAAVWAVATTGDFRSAVLRAVNLGDDADTVGAVTGQIAGRLYGASGIPAEWLDRLAWCHRIERLADTLLDGKISPPSAAG